MIFVCGNAPAGTSSSRLASPRSASPRRRVPSTGRRSRHSPRSRLWERSWPIARPADPTAARVAPARRGADVVGHRRRDLQFRRGDRDTAQQPARGVDLRPRGPRDHADDVELTRRMGRLRIAGLEAAIGAFALGALVWALVLKPHVEPVPGRGQHPLDRLSAVRRRAAHALAPRRVLPTARLARGQVSRRRVPSCSSPPTSCTSVPWSRRPFSRLASSAPCTSRPTPASATAALHRSMRRLPARRPFVNDVASWRLVVTLGGALPDDAGGAARPAKGRSSAGHHFAAGDRHGDRAARARADLGPDAPSRKPPPTRRGERAALSHGLRLRGTQDVDRGERDDDRDERRPPQDARLHRGGARAEALH